MNKKLKKTIKLVITIAIPGLFIYFLIIAPYIEFKSNEKILSDAAKRYYEINSDKLPTGKRVSTVTLKKLFDEAYIKKDIYAPYTNKICSIEQSWVKVVQKEAGEYDYITYLECGVFKSSTDNAGPVIKLKGGNEVTINLGEEYKEPGIESVKDNKDGNIAVKEVIIDSSEIDTNNVGTYKVTYTALDSLKNKTKITRTVNVVQKLNKTVKDATNQTGLYKGQVNNNYILFSGMLFRIVSLDNDNVKIVTEKDISSVNYDGINDWLNYFYDHIADSSKKLIVKNKYCSNKIETEDINTNTECTKMTENKSVHILSNKDINESRDETGDSYLFSDTINWISNEYSDEYAWATKYDFIPYQSSTQFYGFSKSYNFSVRPVLTIKGDTLIVSGDGTENNPYTIGDLTKGKSDEYISTRVSGEYIIYSGHLWRIIETSNDEYTKVIAEKPIDLLENSLIKYETEDAEKIYNPTQKGNIGYTINQKTSDTISEELFATKEISVPIYKAEALYGKETETKKYKVKFSAPNMYELFSGVQDNTGKGYWLINSSKEEFRKYVVSNLGIVMYEKLVDHYETYIRPVGYLDRRVKIVSGTGTKQDPYKISK